jgi:hypothetical protein
MTAHTLTIAKTTADFEDFGDEVVIIDSASGAFYSLKGRAIPLWRACAQGLDLAHLERSLQKLDSDEQQNIRTMLTELTAASILVEQAPGAAGTALEWEGFAATKFEKNDNFDDLIRLDPIHDVSDQGWPNR